MIENVNKPHICFVSESEATYGLLTGKAVKKAGGAYLQQFIVACELRKLGYPVSFVVQDFGQPRKLVTSDGITLIKTCRLNTGIRFLRGLKWIRSALKAMAEAGAEIYYERGAGMITGITAFFCRVRRRVFIYSVAHNDDLDGSWRRSFTAWDYMMYQYGLSHADMIVVQSDDQMQMLHDNLKEKSRLIRSTFIVPPNRQSECSRNSILWVSVVRQMKRPRLFIELSQRLPQYSFVMVGGPSVGEERLYEDICAKAKDIRNLETTGPVPIVEVGEYFDKALLFVNTTSTEGFPNTFLQAWCRGIPVVTTFDPDSIVEKHGLGRYCSNLDELEKAVSELAQNEAMRKQIGERAMKYVYEHHSSESVGLEYDKLFLSLCGD